jgi:hypothetical protein
LIIVTWKLVDQNRLFVDQWGRQVEAWGTLQGISEAVILMMTGFERVEKAVYQETVSDC